MAVYTDVSDEALADFLALYDIGQAVSFKGIAEGVENSNYFLATDNGQRYILTLFEKRTNPADLPYFLGVKQHLARKGFPCPQPVTARDGEALQDLEGRKAVIVTFLDGLSPRQTSPKQCYELGAGMAAMHMALADFPMSRPNNMGPRKWVELWQGRGDTAEEILPGLRALIDSDLSATIAARKAAPSLPRGTIHADLFPDNAFFLGQKFSGAIDFYFACSDALAYDLAIALNAWCFERETDTKVAYNYTKGSQMIAGYQSVRKLTEPERATLPVLARGAALRFFLTRLVDWVDTPKDALVKPKNPLEYAARLQFHRQSHTPESYGVV